MRIIYSDNKPDFEPDEPSIFLVGPTPRSHEVKSWRPQALEILKDLDYKGIVCVPERSNWGALLAYENQVEWEYYCLSRCRSIAAWVPRCMKTMLALTTNVEFGYWLGTRPSDLYYGRPDGAPHTAYLDWLYDKITKRNPYSDLRALLEKVVK